MRADARGRVAHRGGLRLSSCLTSLNLASNRLVGVWFEGGNFKGEYSREAIDAISLAVGGSQTLTMLDLSQNSPVSYVSGVRVPSAQGIQAIADAASKAPALKRLGLAYNSIGATGGASIGTSFGTNKSLEELDISGNLIGHKGGRAVAEAMSLNAAFVSADLRHSSLDAETKQAVMQAAEKRERAHLCRCDSLSCECVDSMICGCTAVFCEVNRKP